MAIAEVTIKNCHCLPSLPSANHQDMLKFGSSISFISSETFKTFQEYSLTLCKAVGAFLTFIRMAPLSPEPALAQAVVLELRPVAAAAAAAVGSSAVAVAL